MAWEPQDFVLANGILDSLFRNVSRANQLLHDPGGNDALLSITSSGGTRKYSLPTFPSAAAGGVRASTGTATAIAGSYGPTATSGGAAIATYYGAVNGIVNMTMGVAGSGADVIVDSLTAPTVVTNFSLRAPSGAGGTVLSTATRNKIADALVTSGANGFGVTSFTLKMFSGTMPSSLPATDTLGNSSAIPNFLGMFGKFENGGLSEIYFKAAVSGVSDASKSDASGISGLAPFYAASSTGTATWGLLLDSAAGNVVLACTCGDTGTEVAVLNNAIITAGSTTPRINAFSYSYP